MLEENMEDEEVLRRRSVKNAKTDKRRSIWVIKFYNVKQGLWQARWLPLCEKRLWKYPLWNHHTIEHSALALVSCNSYWQIYYALVCELLSPSLCKRLLGDLLLWSIYFLDSYVIKSLIVKDSALLRGGFWRVTPGK